MIIGLLGPSPRMDAFAATRRPLTAEEEAEMATLDDYRLQWCSDKLSKLACLRVRSIR